MESDVDPLKAIAILKRMYSQSRSFSNQTYYELCFIEACLRNYYQQGGRQIYAQSVLLELAQKSPALMEAFEAVFIRSHFDSDLCRCYNMMKSVTSHFSLLDLHSHMN